ncbi:hypothetical protein L9F63_017890, partial [Diploptera punctata]
IMNTLTLGCIWFLAVVASTYHVPGRGRALQAEYWSKDKLALFAVEEMQKNLGEELELHHIHESHNSAVMGGVIWDMDLEIYFGHDPDWLRDTCRVVVYVVSYTTPILQKYICENSGIRGLHKLPKMGRSVDGHATVDIPIVWI